MSHSDSLVHIAQALKEIPMTARTYFPYSAGLYFSYTIRGRGSLLVSQTPGWGFGSPYLQTGFSILESHFTLLYVELRGFYNAVRPDELSITTLNMIEDLERLRVLLGLESMNILGHSHGGIVSLGYASRYLERVEKMILVLHALQGHDDSVQWDRLAKKRKDDERYAFGYSQRTCAPPNNDDEYTDQFFKRMSYCFADPEKYHGVFLKTVPNLLDLWTTDALKAGDEAEKFEQVRELSSVKAKTSIIGAIEDPLGSVTVSRVTHFGIRESEMKILEECGHFPWIEQPDRFFEYVVSFLRGQI